MAGQNWRCRKNGHAYTYEEAEAVGFKCGRDRSDIVEVDDDGVMPERVVPNALATPPKKKKKK